MEQMNQEKNNVTVDKVKENIRKFDFKSWVSRGVIFDGVDNMMNGHEIYQRIFNPALFDICGQKRYAFFESIGYIELMNVLDQQKDISKDERIKIGNVLMNLIKECIKPLWIGDFDYPSPVISVNLGVEYPPSYTGWRTKARTKFIQELENRNLSMEEASNIIYESTGKHNFALIKDIFVENIGCAAAERTQRLHEQRVDVSRVMMNANLPADLVPLVCSYAVPNSKTYDYM